MVSKNYKPDVLGLPKKPAAALMRCRSVSTHPPYEEMIMTAIRTLKERTGSSLYVIGKLIEKKYKDLLPSNFRKLLLFRLKKLVSGEKLVRVKNSFKLPPKRLRPSKATATALALALASDGAGAGAGAGVVAGAGKPAAANGNPKAKPQPKKQPSHALRMNPFPLPQPKAAKAQGLQPAKAKQAAC